ncbi:MAG: hypothetical protein JW395_0705 [Nitrospira sp.]|nr:hypothetical protein [Nitrospira sp.]
MPNSISLQELEALNFIRAGSIRLVGRRCQSQIELERPNEEMSRSLLKLSGGSVDDYATFSDRCTTRPSC